MLLVILITITTRMQEKLKKEMKYARKLSVQSNVLRFFFSATFFILKNVIQDPPNQNDSVLPVLLQGESLCNNLSEYNLAVETLWRCVGVCVHRCVWESAWGYSVTHGNEARVLMKWGIKRGGMFAISQAVSPGRTSLIFPGPNSRYTHTPNQLPWEIGPVKIPYMTSSLSIFS